MPQKFWTSVNDLALLFSARPIAIPLILLLTYKLYSLNPATLFYTIGLLLLTVLFAMRWCIHLIAQHKLVYLNLLRQERVRQERANRKNQ